jgi:hypothetical protein
VTRVEANNYLVNAGVDKEVVEQYLNVVDAKVEHSLAKEGIGATKRDYVAGILNAEESLQQLQAMGIAAERSSQYIKQWTIRRSRVRRTATTAQILHHVSTGAVDGNSAYIRLQNLGWDNPDILLMVSEAQSKLAELQARRRKAIDRDAKQQAKALRDAQRETQRLLRQLQADQRRATPRTTLDRWLCDGIISEGWYLRQMAAMGYEPQISQGYLEDAIRKKACAPAPEGKEFNPPPPSNGESGDAGQ